MTLVPTHPVLSPHPNFTMNTLYASQSLGNCSTSPFFSNAPLQGFPHVPSFDSVKRDYPFPFSCFPPGFPKALPLSWVLFPYVLFGVPLSSTPPLSFNPLFACPSVCQKKVVFAIWIDAGTFFRGFPDSVLRENPFFLFQARRMPDFTNNFTPLRIARHPFRGRLVLVSPGAVLSRLFYAWMLRPRLYLFPFSSLGTDPNQHCIWLRFPIHCTFVASFSFFLTLSSFGRIARIKRDSTSSCHHPHQP